VDALDRLVTKDRMTLAPDVLARTRRFLVRRRTRVVQGLLARDPEFRTLRARLTNARDAAKSLDWNSVRLEDVTSALARTVRRALKISQRARVSDREDVRHGWRRRMRRSVQQRAVFAGLGRSPGGAEEGNGTASVISEEGTMQAFTDLVRLLGLEHDLRVLQMTFANAGRFSPGERATLSVAIETEIRRIARKCDRQLYDDEPVVAFEDGE
jgi:hypothetical protein